MRLCRCCRCMEAGYCNQSSSCKCLRQHQLMQMHLVCKAIIQVLLLRLEGHFPSTLMMKEHSWDLTLSLNKSGSALSLWLLLLLLLPPNPRTAHRVSPPHPQPHPHHSRPSLARSAAAAVNRRRWRNSRTANGIERYSGDARGASTYREWRKRPTTL